MWCGVQPAYKRFFVPPNGVRNIVDSISGFNLDRSGSLRYRSGDKLLTNTRTYVPLRTVNHYETLRRK